jgi:hypothetical protein
MARLFAETADYRSVIYFAELAESRVLAVATR